MKARGAAYRVLVRRQEGKRALGRPSCNGKIILKWIFKEEEDVDTTDLS
jgi:hypothetical protein